MKGRIMKMEVKGIKNISEAITINFLGDTINEKITTNNSNVKAIYGPNGSGKSAIMNAVQLYKEITCTYAFFANEDARNRVYNLINKKTNEFSITMYYALTDDDGTVFSVLSHSLLIHSNDRNPCISREEIREYKEKSLNLGYNTVLLIEGGELKTIEMQELDNPFSRIITEKLVPVSDISSVLAFCGSRPIMETALKVIRTLNNKEDSQVVLSEEYKAMFAIMLISLFIVTDLFVVLEDSDKHINSVCEENPIVKMFFSEKGTRVNVDESIVLHRDWESYEKEVNNLKRFIKLFKYDLKDIKVEKKLDREVYHAKKIFVYDDYKVEEDYESTGIKKLVRIYSYLEKAVQGGIVFIDEIDTNVNDVYLVRLIEFFREHGKGQLIITSHSLSPMNVLRKGKRGIDFLDGNSHCRPWIKNSHQSPIKQYSEGYIPGIPLNSEAFDFLSCFSEVDE